MNDVLTAVTNWTVAHSGHENFRGYIGLSGIADCEQVIYDRYFGGSQMRAIGDHLRTRLSFELEAALIERLRQMGMYQERETVSLFGGRVQGNTDGRIGDRILEIKTVAIEDHFPQGKLPTKVYWQVQAYLRYLDRQEAVVIYLARATGSMCAYPLRRNNNIGQLIADKLERLVAAIETHTRPDCSCGKCR